ncbi:MAG: ABC transporter permease [Flavobacteriales bacterium]
MYFKLIKESFVFAVGALVVNKLRSVLSLLGVAIGIFSIIFVLSVVDSMEKDMKESFDMIGSDILFVQKWPMGPEEGDKEYAWWKYMRRRPPQLRDMEKLRERLTMASAIAMQSSTVATTEYKNNFLTESYPMGVTYQYRETIAVSIASGRYFTNEECESGRNYAVIGDKVREQLFGEGDPLGKEITVSGLKVTVIGVFKKEGASLFGNGFDQAVMMPFEYAIRIIGTDSDDTNMVLKSKAGVSNNELRDEVIAVMREVRSIKPGADNDFSVIKSSMISGAIDSIVGVFNLVGLVIGIFSILVGAFSIANIMFVSVSERTNIIGIQKSLGAKNYFILFQFLFESVLLCLFGGFMGLGFVWLLVSALSNAIDFEFILPLSRVVMGISISLVVGIIAGIVPAMKAARLNPVDAIRAK